MKGIKRAIDVLAAATGLLVLSPLLAVLVLLVRRRLGKPAIFRAERLGRGGQAFTLYKLRSMSDEVDANGQLLPDEQRLTPFGARLRSTSLDELPSLLNVLKGEMSLVGPRPFLSRYKERYTPEQNRRHEVRPGITGWAQVNGRNNLTWEERFALDIWYIDHWSLALDAKILLMTFARVLARKDVSTEGEVTSPEFFGSGAVAAPDSPVKDSPVEGGLAKDSPAKDSPAKDGSAKDSPASVGRCEREDGGPGAARAGLLTRPTHDGLGRPNSDGFRR